MQSSLGDDGESLKARPGGGGGGGDTIQCEGPSSLLVGCVFVDSGFVRWPTG